MNRIKKPNINPLQREVDAFMHEMGWDYWNKEKIVRKLREELEEVVVEVKGGNKRKLEIEIGDLIFALSCLCARKKISMDEALRKSIGKFRLRDKDRYPKKSRTHTRRLRS